ncbi:hypothetical protein BGW42_008439 [Actinomortierella wolfii]|nr:hypothetical protein BGW42_008439 [Actinomortierella wolfii]
MVIEWIDNPHDLFNLLTVSRDVFRFAARSLYRNPIMAVTSTNHRYYKIRELVRLLLSLSPTGDKDIDIIRKSIGLPPPGIPLNPQPTLNYLSLVKVIRWSKAFFKGSELQDPHDIFYCGINNICIPLTWAFVGHRLDEVEELEIDVDDNERFLINAPKMTRLRKIWIRFTSKSMTKRMYKCAEMMIKAIQHHHGPYQLHECHLIPNPLRLNHPYDPSAAMIEILSIGDDSFKSRAMMKVYPDYSISQILQRFRGMTRLEIHPEVANGNDEDLLAWAVHEAEHYDHKPGGHHFAPLIRLRELKVRYGVFDRYTPMASRERSRIRKLKVLQDGLLGFSHTLVSLEVEYPQSADGMGDPLFTIPCPLHKLEWLRLCGLAITSHSGWEQAPNIRRLLVNFDYPTLSTGTSTPSESQDNHTIGTTTPLPTPIHTTTTTITTELQPQRRVSEFWFHCPKLIGLTLNNGAINLLDPNCLHLSPNIERMELTSSNEDVRDPSRIIHADYVPCGKREALWVLHPTRWTWDWAFPVLRDLILQRDLHEIRFSFYILRSCSTLSSMILNHNNRIHSFPLRVKGIVDGLLNKDSNQMLSFTHNNLVSIKFQGHWSVEIDELACLLQMLPRLTVLEFGLIHFNAGFGDRELIETTKIHPALRYVLTNMRHTSGPSSALGLVDITNQPRGEMESVALAKDCDSDEVLLNKRTAITYRFSLDGFLNEYLFKL